MALHVGKYELEERYPDASLEGFVPTHRVILLDAITKQIIQEDFVFLELTSGPVKYGYVPGQKDPRYGVISSGKWQCLDRHGLVRSKPIRYLPDYVPMSERVGFVYFVESGPGGPLKIGWSQDVDSRICQLQTANAMPLRLVGKVPGTLQDEASLHKRFAHLRMEAEWFQNSSEIHDWLRSNGGFPIENPNLETDE